jgi:hypothetical protein
MEVPFHQLLINTFTAAAHSKESSATMIEEVIKLELH